MKLFKINSMPSIENFIVTSLISNFRANRLPLATQNLLVAKPRELICMFETYQWQWANVRPIAAYRRTQRSSLQLGLRVGGHLALTDFGPDEPQ